MCVPQTTQEQRSEVHRKPGHVLLRLQQYELLSHTAGMEHPRGRVAKNNRSAPWLDSQTIKNVAATDCGQSVLATKSCAAQDPRPLG